MSLLIWLVLLIVALLIFLVIIFNRFARNRNFVQDAWSNIDVMLKKRYELVPNLVATVKAYVQHESATFEKVVQARNAAMQVSSDDIQGKIEAENQLSQTLKGILILSEAYPDLKASDSFLTLQIKLSDIEESIERSRRYYNGTVRINNSYGESFPGILFASLFKYKHYNYFEVNEASRQVVDVDFEK